MRFNAKVVFWAVVMTAAAALAVTAFFVRTDRVEVEGAVVAAAGDVQEQSPVEGVDVTVRRASAVVTTRSDAAGFFRLRLPAGIARGQSVVLAFRHAGYRPLDLRAVAGDQLLVARIAPLAARPVTPPPRTEVPVANVRMRYTIAVANVVNVGSGVKMFQAINQGNVPCNHRDPCSPDGKWKAAIGSATLDAGPENEFRNARVSCIAGPCPFTRIDADNFSRGGHVISVTVRNWSDTVTFVLQAEVVRPQIDNVVRETYPVTLGRTMTFTLPTGAQGPSIQAEIAGQEIVFPLGPTLLLSWATCDARAGPNQSGIYHCELKPGYRFP